MNTRQYKTLEDKIIGTLFTGENQVTDSYSRNDLLIESKGITYIGEVKVRNFKSTKFDWVMEVKKLYSLIEIFNTYPKGKAKVLYINYFTDNKIVVWDMEYIVGTKKYIKSRQLMNKTTDKSFKGSGRKVWKDIIYLAVKNASRIVDIKL